jgi:hypothetical protein
MSKFDAYQVSLELIPALRPVARAVALHDRSLADQIRRAGSSVPLNIAEGARRFRLRAAGATLRSIKRWPPTRFSIAYSRRSGASRIDSSVAQPSRAGACASQDACRAHAGICF